MFRWARERAGFSQEDLLPSFKNLQKWEDDTDQELPTLKELRRFARKVKVGLGYLFLPEPPAEPIPIDDFRTVGGKGMTRPTPNLLDTIYACQRRQSWYQQYVLAEDGAELEFIGSASLSDNPVDVATRMRELLGFDMSVRDDCKTWEEAFGLLIDRAEEAGVLVMVSGIVGSSTSRQLDVNEFRGFALSDRLAPLVFINGRDAKAAQIFTLAHELAHLWLGQTALSNFEFNLRSGHKAEEVWCNKVAAEFLVPLAVLREATSPDEALGEALPRLARAFKVSQLVILRRLLDAEIINRESFYEAWEEEYGAARTSKQGGGNFYGTTLRRVGRRFARAVVFSALVGKTNYQQALRLLNVRKPETIRELGRKLQEEQ